MNDPHSTGQPHHRSWLERLGHILSNEPKDREELQEILRDATDRHLLNKTDLHMLEGVFRISQLQVRDIMIPRSQMQVVEKTATLKEILPIVIENGHSRYPIIGENKDEVLGILLSKDLLPYGFNKTLSFNIQALARPAVVVPESKRLDILLQEFRTQRSHMAIVIDEYGGVIGLVTIEDVLEQIVGNIEDEYDDLDDPNEQPIKQLNETTHLIKGFTTLEEFNTHFEAHLKADDVETVGGLVIRGLGYLPKKGELFESGEYHFKVLRADKRRISLLQLTRLTAAAEIKSMKH